MALDPVDPSMQDPSEGESMPGGAGYTIELKIGADGSIKVGVEPEAEESQEEGSMPAGEDGEYQSVPDIREAIKLVLDIFKNAGQTADPSAEQDQMAQGYK